MFAQNAKPRSGRGRPPFGSMKIPSGATIVWGMHGLLYDKEQEKNNNGWRFEQNDFDGTACV